MPTRRDVVTSPALIPIAGNFDRKPRTLEREVTTIGRARGSDLCLEANEISTLHCIIYRAADGYRIRDCNSRCGTRINGQSVKTGRLQDCDIVNLGPFSFEFRLPGNLFPDAKQDPAKVEHWKNSRKKLAEFALKMRKRARLGRASVEVESAQKANLLKEKIRAYDQRLRELEEAEEELQGDREKLRRDVDSQQDRVQQIETELAARLAKTDEEIKERWQEFQQRCQAEETKARQAAAAAATAAVRPVEPAAPASPNPSPVAADTEALERHLHQIEKQLTRQQEQLEREQREFTTMKEQWVRAQTKSAQGLEEQQAALAQQEAALRMQKAELARMMGELKKLQEDLRKHAKPDARAALEEMEAMRRENAELRAALDTAASPEDLQAQVKLLQDELETKELELMEMREAKAPAPGHSNDAANLRAQNELLNRLLEEKNKILEELSSQKPAEAQAAPKDAMDLEHYEAELNEFRRQLEEDRNKLNAELEMLRERNGELDEAVREMEMELSKERAELARERMRLERVREEIKSDMEKLQREANVRDTLGGVQKLRDEMNGKQGKDKSVSERLRTMRASDSATTSS